MRSDIIQKMLDEMDNEPFFKKLKRRIRVKLWIYRCMIFNRRKSKF